MSKNPFLGLGFGGPFVSFSREIESGGGGYVPTDSDAAAYISNVEQADGSSLEDGIKEAIDNFVIGCKSDGIWSAIKSCCILAGARTLSGALIPLVGSAPTNGNFVSGDYDRIDGLSGDGSTKYLDTNRANNADPQDSNHMAVYVTQFAGAAGGVIGSSSTSSGNNGIFHTSGQSNTEIFWRLRNGSGIATGSMALGFVGGARDNSTTVRVLTDILDQDYVTFASGTPTSDNINVFRRGTSNYWEGSLSFYSVGENLSLSLYNTRMTALMTAISSELTV